MEYVVYGSLGFFVLCLLIFVSYHAARITFERSRKHNIDDRFIWIYILIDPFDFTVRYIGQSVQPYRRLKQHTKDKVGTTAKQRWIASLRGTSPLMAIIDQCESQVEANKMEKYWIALLWKHGAPLTNTMAMADAKANEREEFSVKPIYKK